MPEPTIPDLAEVLVEVNHLRAERGLPSLSEMPHESTGVFRCTSCPLAVALDAFVGTNKWTADPWHTGATPPPVWHPLPEVLQAFRLSFDHGRYPELGL